ncbi:tetratricopeptide repeat protein [Neptuniibacter caesariensis]|nr:tetratricopeptide repeat protein [Neptuniibacter caesariensis]
MMRAFLSVFLFVLCLNANGASKALSQAEYKLLTSAHALMETGQWVTAQQQLEAAQPKMRSDYAKALLAHNLAQVSLQRERYKSAIKHLLTAQSLKALPENQQINILHTLGQLHCMEEAWKKCTFYLSDWMKTAPGDVRANDHLLIAQAYSQLEKWHSVLPHIGKAIAQRNIAPENWYQLKIAAHINLKQWKSAAKVQQVLVKNYSTKAQHWRQLVSLHMQAGDRKAALATQRLGYQRKLLRNGKDHKLLAQLLLSHSIPFHAGEVMAAGLKRGVLKADRRNLELLGTAWIQAKENDKAVKVMERLYRVLPTEKNAQRLAQAQLQAEQWHGAEKTLLHALRSKPKKPATLQLMLGIARINLKHYPGARDALVEAGSHGQHKTAVNNWLRYLDQMDAATEQRG